MNINIAYVHSHLPVNQDTSVNTEQVMAQESFSDSDESTKTGPCSFEIIPEDHSIIVNKSARKLYPKVKSSDIISRRDSHYLDLEKLNKIGVYILLKPVKIERDDRIEREERKDFSIIPISNYDKISDHDLSRLILHRDIAFRAIMTEDMYLSEQRNSANKMFLLRGLITPGPSNDGFLKTRLEELDIEEQNEEISEEEEFDRISSEEFDEVYTETELRRLWKGLEEFEYEEGQLDTIYSNPQKYFSTRLKNYMSEEHNTNLIPVFFDSDTAHDFLTIVMEESLEPYQKKKFMGTADSLLDFRENYPYGLYNEDYDLITDPNSFISRLGTDEEVYQARNLDYLDDQISFVNKISPKNYIKRAKNWLSEKRWLKPTETEESYNISNSTSRAENVLFDSILDIKIIKMGLGDFLKMYLEESNKEDSDPKSIELLFIPSTKEKEFNKQNKLLKSSRLKMTKDIASNPFYEYQKKFYTQLQQEQDSDFTYEFEGTDI
nr:hypothetical protein [Ishige okamurae]